MHESSFFKELHARRSCTVQMRATQFLISGRLRPAAGIPRGEAGESLWVRGSRPGRLGSCERESVSGASCRRDSAFPAPIGRPQRAAGKTASTEPDTWRSSEGRASCEHIENTQASSCQGIFTAPLTRDACFFCNSREMVAPQREYAAPRRFAAGGQSGSRVTGAPEAWPVRKGATKASTQFDPTGDGRTYDNSFDQFASAPRRATARPRHRTSATRAPRLRRRGRSRQRPGAGRNRQTPARSAAQVPGSCGLRAKAQ